MKAAEIITLIWMFICLIIMNILAYFHETNYVIIWGVYTILSFIIVLGYEIRDEINKLKQK